MGAGGGLMKFLRMVSLRQKGIRIRKLLEYKEVV